MSIPELSRLLPERSSGASRSDIHVHSKHSDRPSEWYLERVGSPESFTEPVEVYRLAKARGMDFVTISDHDSLAGALAIAHLPGTYLASEDTVTFPEDGTDVHILVLGPTEAQHAELQRLKGNLYEWRAYARAERLAHVVAHPLFRVNDRLDADHVEKLLVLFRVFEAVNGTRDPRATELFDAVLAGMTPAVVEALAEKHRLPLDEPPRYATTGGSDDHGGLYVATTWTETPLATTAAEFLEHFKSAGAEPLRRCRRGGEAGSSLKLARSFQLLAHDYYRAKILGGSKLRNDPFADLLRRIAANELDPDRPEGNAWGRTVRKLLAFAPPAPLVRPAPVPAASGRGAEVDAALAREEERRVFESSCRLAQRIAGRVLERLATEIEAGDFLRALPALSDLAPAAVALSPYVAAFRFQHKDEPLHRAVAERFAAARALRDKSPKVAWATDTLGDVNGVARTIANAATLAHRRGVPVTVLSAEPVRFGGRAAEFPVESFAPIWETPIPRYEELTLRVPPVLELVEHCEREAYGRILVSTPGPVGLAAVAAGKLLGVPLAGIYHTDFPRHVTALAGNGKLEGVARSAARWFYRQMDEVYVSGSAYRRELEAMGVEPARIRDLPRGVDSARFHPARRRADFFAGRLPGAAPIVLYVGRLSREKNLDALFEAMAALAARGVDARLAVVGDGPDRVALERRWAGERIAFTGALEGDELATAYASADLFAFPSRTDTFGNVVLEAMASGLACVVSTDGGPAEQIRDGVDGVVVDLDERGAFAAAIAEALAAPERRARLGRAARAAAENRSWDRLLAALFPGHPSVASPAPVDAAPAATEIAELAGVVA